MTQHLYVVRSTKNDKVQDSFDKKMPAKELRDKLNGGKWSDENTSKEFVVSRGVDHPHGKSGLTPDTPKTFGSSRKKKV